MRIDIPDFPHEWVNERGLTDWNALAGAFHDGRILQIGTLFEWLGDRYVFQITIEPYNPKEPATEWNCDQITGHLKRWGGRSSVSIFGDKFDFPKATSRDDAYLNRGGQVRDEVHRVFNICIHRSIVG